MLSPSTDLHLGTLPLALLMNENGGVTLLVGVSSKFSGSCKILHAVFKIKTL